MINDLFYFFLISILIPDRSKAQEIFSRYYLSNISNNEIRVNEIAQKKDNGFFLSGTGDHPNNVPTYIGSVDSTGNLQWSGFYRDSLAYWQNSFLDISKFSEVNNDGLLAIGSTLLIDDESRYVITHLDNTGNVEWAKMLHDSITNFPDERFNCITSSFEGGFILAGSHGILVHADSSGTILTAQYLDTSLVINDIAKSSEHKYIVLADNDKVITIDSALSVIRTFQINKPGLFLTSLLQSSDGGFLATGILDSANHTYNAPLMIKTDSLGFFQFMYRSSFVHNSYQMHSPSAIQMNDSGYYFGTYTRTSPPKAVLLKTTSTGTLISSVQYDSLYHNLSYTDKLTKTQNGGFASMMYFNQSVQLLQMLVATFDSNGYTSCGTVPVVMPWFIDSAGVSALNIYPQTAILSSETRIIWKSIFYGNSPRCYIPDILGQQSLLKEVMVSPNPFSSSCILSFGSKDFSEQTYFILFDQTGRRVAFKEVFTMEFIFERKNLVSGIYFYLLTTGSSVLGKGKLLID